jgi:hypothetical protein
LENCYRENADCTASNAVKAFEPQSVSCRQEGHFDEPKSKRSKRHIPLGPRCVEIFAALKHAEPHGGGVISPAGRSSRT